MKARIATALLLPLLGGGCVGDPPPPVVPATARLHPAEPGVIRIAGSGAMVPLARALAVAYAREVKGAPRLLVEASIGSGGGLRATAEGAVDLGMMSRPLEPAEARDDLVVLPAALDAVVIGAHPEAPIDGLQGDELRRFYTGEARTFFEGSPVTVLLRDRGESANTALEAVVPGLTEARLAAYRAGRARVIYHDQSMVEALVALPGALGVVSLGALGAARSSVKVLRLDGREPTVDHLEGGSWPARRTLTWVVRRSRWEELAPFLRFAYSPAARRLARDRGYVVVPAPALLGLPR